MGSLKQEILDSNLWTCLKQEILDSGWAAAMGAMAAACPLALPTGSLALAFVYFCQASHIISHWGCLIWHLGFVLYNMIWFGL